jgi:hypothetical protein
LEADYQFGARVEDFGRQLGAGLVNSSSQLAVHIPAKKGFLLICKTLSSHLSGA